MRRIRIGVAVLAVVLAALLGEGARGAEPTWVETARRTHARFTGRAGTLAQLGDSITVSMAHWAPLQGERRNAPAAMDAAYRRVAARLRPECWREWKGPEFGSEGGQTVAWARANVDGWLEKLNPEVALIMFGTNDLNGVEPAAYREGLRALADRCTQNGTVAILTTIPPRHGFEGKSGTFAQAARDVAAELRLPLVDYHAEILKRRPDDWDGALERFSQYRDYDVPTLIARDGVHPSFPAKYQSDYSEEGLRSSGYTLRNYLSLLKYDEVVRALER